MNPAWIFISIGALLVLLALYRIAFGWISFSWPQVEAHLDSCSVEDSLVGMAGKGHSRVSRVRLSYTYTLHGKAFRGRRYDFGGSGYSARHYDAETEPLMISYCPLRPSFSVVHPGVMGSSYILLLVGLLFACPAVMRILG